jgi:hypothetical protein
MPTAITPTTMYSATFVPRHLQLVRSANVQQAQAEHHERDAVEDDVAHRSLLLNTLTRPVAPARRGGLRAWYAWHRYTSVKRGGVRVKNA